MSGTIPDAYRSGLFLAGRRKGVGVVEEKGSSEKRGRESFLTKHFEPIAVPVPSSPSFPTFAPMPLE